MDQGLVSVEAVKLHPGKEIQRWFLSGWRGALKWSYFRDKDKDVDGSSERLWIGAPSLGCHSSWPRVRKNASLNP